MPEEPPPPKPSRLRWRNDEEFELEGVEYVCRPRFDTFESTAERFCIRKPREDIERLEALLERTRPKRILELGIHKGGSTALIAQLAEPEQLVALDIDTPESADGLRAFIEARGLEGSVKAHWEVDGSDPDRLGQVLAAELPDVELLGVDRLLAALDRRPGPIDLDSADQGGAVSAGDDDLEDQHRERRALRPQVHRGVRPRPVLEQVGPARPQSRKQGVEGSPRLLEEVRCVVDDQV